MSSITFVLLAHNEKYDYIVSLGSLMCQTNPNWEAVVFHNGPNESLRSDIMRSFSDRRISFRQTPEDNGTDTINREFAWNRLVDTEWMVSTSIQDYYLPKTVENILKYTGHNDFIFWNSMNNHWLENQILDCHPEINKIDWGNFAIRTELAQKVGMNHHRVHNADGRFVLDVMATNPRWHKISKMLTIHN